MAKLIIKYYCSTSFEDKEMFVEVNNILPMVVNNKREMGVVIECKCGENHLYLVGIDKIVDINNVPNLSNVLEESEAFLKRETERGKEVKIDATLTDNLLRRMI